jgi:hypothetical protein
MECQKVFHKVEKNYLSLSLNHVILCVGKTPTPKWMLRAKMLNVLTDTASLVGQTGEALNFYLNKKENYVIFYIRKAPTPWWMLPRYLLGLSTSPILLADRIGIFYFRLSI